jgi:hypothetical protein
MKIRKIAINWPNVLTAISCVSTALATGTAICSGMKIQKEFGEKDIEAKKEKAKTVLKNSILPLIFSAISIGTGIASRRCSAKELTAAVAVGAAGAKRIKDEFDTYRETTKEVVGEEKEKEIFDKTIEKRLVKGNDYMPDEIVTKFRDPYNNVYFYDTPGNVMKGFAWINDLIFNPNQAGWGMATWADFYIKIGHPDLVTDQMRISGWANDICAVNWEAYFLEFFFERHDGLFGEEPYYIIHSCCEPELDVNWTLKDMEEKGII